MPDIMKMGKNPNYLGSWDLEELPNKEVTLTIAKIVDEDVVTNGKKERCTVCYWAEPGWKPMIWNVTNKKTVAKVYHTKDTEQLVGKAGKLRHGKEVFDFHAVIQHFGTPILFLSLPCARQSAPAQP